MESRETLEARNNTPVHVGIIYLCYLVACNWSRCLSKVALLNSDTPAIYLSREMPHIRYEH